MFAAAMQTGGTDEGGAGSELLLVPVAEKLLRPSGFHHGLLAACQGRATVDLVASLGAQLIAPDEGDDVPVEARGPCDLCVA